MIVVTAGKFCTQDCIKDYGMNRTNKVIDSVKRKRDQDDRLAKKIFKGNDVRLQHRLTQKAFNKMRVLQELKWFSDKSIEPYCISCKKTNMDWCCGHLKTVGSQGALRYSEINTYLQCNRYCNMGLSGNISGNKNTIGYLAGLVERFGADETDLIINYCSVDRVKTWTGSELIEMRNGFNRKIKSLRSFK